MRYVIVGNGIAGVTAAFVIRARESSAEITLISGESDYFFSRTALMYAYMDRMTVRDLEPYERKVYDAQRIHRISGWVVDLDASRNILQLASGRPVEYDRLLLATGSLGNRPDWNGWDHAKSGIVHFVTLQDLQRCERLTRRGGEAVVVGGGLIGVELVECLVHHGMNVTFLVREPWYWPAALGGEEGRMISEHIRKHGVKLIHDELIEEVMMDSAGRVSGVKAAGGKTYTCEFLGVAIGVHPAVEWLKAVSTPPSIGRGILVSTDFRTSLENIWAAGDCAEITLAGRAPLVEQIWYSAKRQGELAGRSMLGDPVSYEPPVFYNSAKFFELEYTTVGAVNFAPDSAVSFYARHATKEVSVRIVEYAGAVIGFNMIGSRWNHTFFERWIDERRSLDYVVAHLCEGQFDVEFGQQELQFVHQAYSSRDPLEKTESAWSRQARSNG